MKEKGNGCGGNFDLEKEYQINKGGFRVRRGSFWRGNGVPSHAETRGGGGGKWLKSNVPLVFLEGGERVSLRKNRGTVRTKEEKK